MKRATAKVWTRAEVLTTIKALKGAEYCVKGSAGKYEAFADENGKDLVFRAIQVSPNTWLIRYDAALFDESLLLLEDDK